MVRGFGCPAECAEVLGVMGPVCDSLAIIRALLIQTVPVASGTLPHSLLFK